MLRCNFASDFESFKNTAITVKQYTYKTALYMQQTLSAWSTGYYVVQFVI